MIGAAWAKEPTAVKDHYTQLAALEKNEHFLKYPDYKCSPRKSSEIKRRKIKKTVSVVIQGDIPVDHIPLPSEGTDKENLNNAPDASPHLYHAGEFNTDNMSLSQEQLHGTAPISTSTNMDDEEFFYPNIDYDSDVSWKDYESSWNAAQSTGPSPPPFPSQPLQIDALDNLEEDFSDFQLEFLQKSDQEIAASPQES